MFRYILRVSLPTHPLLCNSFNSNGAARTAEQRVWRPTSVHIWEKSQCSLSSLLMFYLHSHFLWPYAVGFFGGEKWTHFTLLLEWEDTRLCVNMSCSFNNFKWKFHRFQCCSFSSREREKTKNKQNFQFDGNLSAWKIFVYLSFLARLFSLSSYLRYSNSPPKLFLHAKANTTRRKRILQFENCRICCALKAFSSHYFPPWKCSILSIYVENISENSKLLSLSFMLT